MGNPPPSMSYTMGRKRQVNTVNEQEDSNKRSRDTCSPQSDLETIARARASFPSSRFGGGSTSASSSSFSSPSNSAPVSYRRDVFPIDDQILTNCRAYWEVNNVWVGHAEYRPRMTQVV
jgi:hypothetical protein